MTGSSQQAAKNASDACASNPSGAACQQCSANPSSAACQNALAAQNIQAPEQGQGGFAGGKAHDPGSFNLADNTDASRLPQAIAGEASNGALQYKTIANNSGGGIPGAGGGGPGASLGGSGKKGGGGSSGSSSSLTDIDEGFRSGGYSQPVGGGGGFGVDTSGSEQFGKRAPASAGGLDLKAYLPGGARDPNSRVGAGGLRPPGTQIHGPHVDMWARITDRIREKCKIGELYGCS